MGSANGEEHDMAEADYERARTSVWWDIDNCNVPRSASDPHSIARNISSALAKLNYRGPISISAYGDTTHISQAAQYALNSTGIALNHVPSGVKDASDKKILVDMLLWAVDNPAPANYLLISGDRDFSNALHQLRMRRYNILLAQPQKASAPLVTAAKSIWLWTSLLAGGSPLASSDLVQLKKDSVVSSAETLQSLPVSNTTDLEKASSSLFESSPTMGTGSASSKIKRKHKKTVSNSCGNSCTAEPGCTESSVQVSLETSSPFERLDAYGYIDASFSNHMNQSSSPHMPSQNNLDMQFGFKQETFYPSSSYAHPPHPVPFVQPLHNNFSRRPPECGLPRVSSPSPFQRDNTQLRQPSPMEFTAPDPSGWEVSAPDPSGWEASAPDPSGWEASAPHPSGWEASAPHPSGWEGSAPHPSGWEVSAPHPSGWEVSPPSSVTSAAETPDDVVSETSSSSGLSRRARDRLQVDAILTALRTLKSEKITPTEGNITDCNKYGEQKYQSVDAKLALREAVKRQIVVKQNLGAVEVYIRKNGKVWDCVDPLGSEPKQYPEATWTEIKRFLRLSSGKKKILASKCRYEAAVIMKKKCLQQHSLGDVLLLLNLIITVKRWLMPEPSGWQPIKILLPDVKPKKNG